MVGMTPHEFTSNAIAWHGSAHNWVGAVSKALNVNRRTVQRIANNGNVSPRLGQALLNLIGEVAPQVVHAEWVNGEGDDGREYLIHTRKPKFQALIITDGDDYDLDSDAGIKYAFDDCVLCGFQWIDPMPNNVTELLERAGDAVQSILDNYK